MAANRRVKTHSHTHTLTHSICDEKTAYFTAHQLERVHYIINKILQIVTKNVFGFLFFFIVTTEENFFFLFFFACDTIFHVLVTFSFFLPFRTEFELVLLSIDCIRLTVQSIDPDLFLLLYPPLQKWRNKPRQSLSIQF